jgi:hypothetical protein
MASGVSHPVAKFELQDEKTRNAFAVAGHLLKCYVASRAGLNELGILRTERTLQGDYAEWLCARSLNLTLSSSTVQRGIDARDAAGNTYQIKSRIVRTLTESTSFDLASNELNFDWLLAVFFTRDFDALGVIRVPRTAVIELGTQTSSTFRFRWNRSAARHPRIERLLWHEEMPESRTALK